MPLNIFCAVIKESLTTVVPGSLYFPMQAIISVDNQRLIASVIQIWFRKNGYHLSLNRTEFESESTNANIGKNLQTVKESGQALSER